MKRDLEFYEIADRMSLKELEEIILSIWNSSRLLDELSKMNECLERRGYLLNCQAIINESVIKELKRVNRLLTKHSLRVCAEAEELFERLKTNALMGYDNLTVTAQLFVDDNIIDLDDDSSGSNYTAMAEVLSDAISTLPSVYLFEMSLRYNREDGQEDSNYMCLYDEDGRLFDDWFGVTFGRIIAEEDQFEVIHPLHCLYDHSPYSLQDIIRIKNFKSEITATFD